MTDIGTAVSITDIERTNLSEFQKSYYSKKDVDARFFSYSRKIAWNNNVEVRMECKDNSDNEYIISISKQFHFIKGIYMVVKLPKIEVAEVWQDVVKIAYTNNLAHHIHGQATLSIKRKSVCKLFPLSLDTDRVTRIDDVFEYDEDIGNKEELLTYKTCIKSDILKMTVPWPFFLHESKALPLYNMCFEGVDIEIIQKFNLDLSKLIKVIAKNKDGVWTRVPFDSKYIKKGSKIPIPEMWGRYSNIGKKELETRKKIEETDDIIIEFIDCVEIDTHDSKFYGETSKINISSNSPIIGVVWMLQNQDALKYNDLSNFSTDSFSKEHGKNPCITSEIKYANTERISERPHYHFDSIYPKIYFKHKPIDPGYNFYFWNDSPLSTKIGNSIIPKNIGPVHINSKIGNGIENDDTKDLETMQNGKIKKIKYLEEDNDKKINSPKFSPFAIIYTMKRLILDHKQKEIFVISDDMLYENYMNPK